jgi:tetratricopeptide (TPR) repeat protein
MKPVIICIESYIFRGGFYLKYGEMIKKARTDLKLNQSILTSSNLSTAAVSDIEKEKVNLTSSKALLIYEILVTQSFEKNIKIELNFDELLNDNIKYSQMRQARNIIDKLRKAKENNEDVQKFELENDRLFAIRNDVGMLKYFIFRAIAELTEDKEFKVKVLFNSLDYLKWLKFEEIHEKYDETLKKVTSISYETQSIKELLNYYEFFEQNSLDLGIQIQPIVYFNLGLLYARMLKYELAYKNVERYIDFNRELELSDRIDALIILGNISTENGEFHKGINIYRKALELCQTGNYVTQEAKLLSNLILNISINNLDLKDEIKTYIDKLKFISDNSSSYQYSRYLNLSIGSFYIERFDDFNQYLIQSISFSKSENEKLRVLDEVLKFVKNKDEIKKFEHYLDEIAFEKLSDNSKLIFMTMVFYVHNAQLPESLNKYINEYYGGENE